MSRRNLDQQNKLSNQFDLKLEPSGFGYDVDSEHSLKSLTREYSSEITNSKDHQEITLWSVYLNFQQQLVLKTKNAKYTYTPSILKRNIWHNVKIEINHSELILTVNNGENLIYEFVENDATSFLFIPPMTKMYLGSSPAEVPPNLNSFYQSPSNSDLGFSEDASFKVRDENPSLETSVSKPKLASGCISQLTLNKNEINLAEIATEDQLCQRSDQFLCGSSSTFDYCHKKGRCFKIPTCNNLLKFEEARSPDEGSESSSKELKFKILDRVDKSADFHSTVTSLRRKKTKTDDQSIDTLFIHGLELMIENSDIYYDTVKFKLKFRRRKSVSQEKFYFYYEEGQVKIFTGVSNAFRTYQHFLEYPVAASEIEIKFLDPNFDTGWVGGHFFLILLGPKTFRIPAKISTFRAEFISVVILTSKSALS